MSRELLLELGGDRSELQRITTAVEELAREEGWPEDVTFQIALVLEELQVNIAEYAYPEGVEPHSRILLRCDDGRLTIEITDEGRPFNPLEDSREPDIEASLDDRKVGGLGVHFVKTLMDDISYSRDGDSNRLTLVKGLGQ